RRVLVSGLAEAQPEYVTNLVGHQQGHVAFAPHEAGELRAVHAAVLAQPVERDAAVLDGLTELVGQGLWFGHGHIEPRSDGCHRQHCTEPVPALSMSNGFSGIVERCRLTPS